MGRKAGGGGKQDHILKYALLLSHKSQLAQFVINCMNKPKEWPTR